MKRAIWMVAVLALMMGSSRANAAFTVAWTGASDGDTGSMTINITPIVVNQLSSITGGGYSHNHGATSTVFTLDLHVNGSWLTIKSWTHDGNDHLLSERTSGGPIAFTGGTVDGIRFTDTPVVGNGFHGMYGSYLASGTTTFTFDNVSTNTVPAPAGLVLLATAAPFAGYFGLRRRKQVAAV